MRQPNPDVEALLPAVYEELRRLASSYLRRERNAQSMQPTALVHEVYLRLLYDKPRRGTAGSRINFVHPKDAGGVLIELVEPAATP